MAATLTYSNVATPPTRAWLLVALLAGVIPMCCGIAIAVLYWLTFAAVLPMLGLICLLIGFVVILAGLLALTIHYHKHLKAGLRPLMHIRIETALVALLLLANFPAAVGCIWLGDRTASTLRVHVVNDSEHVVERLRILLPSGDVRDLGDFAPGESARRRVLLSGEGTVTGEAIVEGERVEFVLVGYITNGHNDGPDKTVTFSPGSSRPSVR